MQRTNERQETNGHAKEEKEVIIFFGSDSNLYQSDGLEVTPILKQGVGESYSFSMVCDPTDWDVPHMYPKKRKKRKKGFDREITRVKDNQPAYRQSDTLHKQFSHSLKRTGRKNSR